jgi:hypothetical protein
MGADRDSRLEGSLMNPRNMVERGTYTLRYTPKLDARGKAIPFTFEKKARRDRQGKKAIKAVRRTTVLP